MDRTTKEIQEILSSSDSSPSMRLDAVLSAIYYEEDTKFVGDLLINEFSTAEYEEKIFFTGLFGTFYGMRQTDYRANDSVDLFRKYKREHPEHAAEIDSVIEEIEEYESMFKRG